jgi:ubiquinone/menaquinone biosynthesis C-methylase UbiE
MIKELEQYLVSPQFKTQLVYDDAEKRFYSEKGYFYPLNDGIIDFVEPEVSIQPNPDAYKKVAKMYDKAFGFNVPWYVRLYNKIVWGFSNEQYAVNLIGSLPKLFDGVLLDVPVGTGVFTVDYYKQIPNATKIIVDYSLNMLKIAQERFKKAGIENVVFIRADVGNLPIRNECVDLVINMNGFHAFPEKEKAIENIHRILKNKSIFASSFYIKNQRKFTDRIVNSYYTKKGWFTPPYYSKEEISSWFAKYFEFQSLENQKAILYFTTNKKAKKG